MTLKGGSLEGLGEDVRGIGCRLNIFNGDIFAVNSISDEVKLDANVSSLEGCLSCGSNGEACMIVFSNHDRPRNMNVKLIKELMKVECLGSGSTKRDVFSLGSRLGNGRLQFGAVANGSTTQEEAVAGQGATIACQSSEIAIAIAL
jgi:hypothetical protein